MGGRVGAIASAFGSKQVQLSHVGKVFPTSEQNLSRWRVWWKYVVADQVWLWAIGCFLGMFLNVNLATAITAHGTDLTGPAAGAYQAKFLAEHFWTGLWYLGLMNGFWILFSTHLGNTDILVRTITDILWVDSDRAVEDRKLTASKLYYTLLFGFTIWGVVVVHLGTVMSLFQILAAIAGFVLVPSAIQLLIINTTLLPKELRPAWWRRIALVLCALFYGVVCCMVIADQWQKATTTKAEESQNAKS
jgi:hypothetical protein